MGWRNKHDFKIKSIYVFFIILLISSCTINVKPEDFNYDSVSGQKSEVVDIKNNGNTFFITWNTRSRTMNVNDALVVKTKHRRSAEEFEDISANSIKSNPNYFIDKKNNDIINSLTSAGRNVEPRTLEVKKITAEVGDTKKIWCWETMTTNNDNVIDVYFEKDAICKYAGEHCIVWYIANDGVDITDQDCENLGAKFDTIYELETKLVGSNIYKSTPYIDVISPQDKIELVFTDLWNDKSTSSTIIGYQSTLDAILQEEYEKYKSSSYNPKYDGHSNESQIIYLDTYIYKLFPGEVYSTLTHEFNHLLNYCQKSLLRGLPMNTWYTEMLAMLTEDAFQNYLGLSDIDSSKARLLDYCQPSGYTTSPFDWPDLNNNMDIIAYSYASTYALGAYLVRNFGGLQLMHEIATNDSVEFDSIDEALIKCGYDFDYESDSLKSFNAVFFNEPYFLINIEPKTNEDINTINKPNNPCYYTLNRTWKDSSFPELSFDAIDLIGSITYKNDKGEDKTLYYEPQYMNPEKSYKGYVYKNSFTIWDLGSNLKSVKVETEKNFEIRGFWEIIYPQK